MSTASTDKISTDKIDLLEQVLSASINKILQMDPELAGRLAVLDDKVICIHFNGIEKTLYLRLVAQQIRLQIHYDGKVDTCISGAPLAIIRMLMKSDTSSSLLKGEVEIKGDTRLGNDLKKLFQKMDIDWQQPLSQLIGDPATQLLETGIKSLLQWGKKSIRSTALSSSEYLQEESRDLISDTELEIFHRQVDTLRNDIARFELKLNNLN